VIVIILDVCFLVFDFIDLGIKLWPSISVRF